MAIAKKILLVLICGAIGGTLGDLMHVLSGVDGYPPQAPGEFRFYSGMAAWVAPQFALATLSIAGLMPLCDPIFERILGKPKRERPGVQDHTLMLIGIASLLVVWTASGFLPLATGGSKDIVLAVAAIGIWWWLDRTLTGLVMSVIGACFGTAVEMYMASRGIFYYTPAHANFYGVPSWLPWLYIVAGPAVGNLGRRLFKN